VEEGLHRDNLDINKSYFYVYDYTVHFDCYLLFNGNIVKILKLS
jgi:hypothetical protein